ncbi:MAG: DUF58 domain-containing protein [Leptolyngbya sp. SIO1E4]|nr:DUF58 domain-containing protein [Leptolyngbya sp. SIO1E4]
MARLGKSWLTWLETHWVVPAYGGGVLLGLTIAFFGAAINTMSGWLYAISGVMSAILLINIWSPPRSLMGIQAHRNPMRPISVGEVLAVEIVLENLTSQPKVLLQARDNGPPQMGDAPETAIAVIPVGAQHTWRYTCRPTRRGIYHWETLSLRTAAPLGLFWCQRPKPAPAQATVYPKILPLTRCPLIDHLGMSTGLRWQTAQRAESANEGLTRALRPYRWGDPTRLIHWRTSARYGELRVRELEQLTADNQVLIGLDTGDRWSEEAFEFAVTTAASLYIYSLRRQLSVALWLPHTGILQNKHTVLSALAAVMPGKLPPSSRFPAQPMIWLGSSGQAPPNLSPGSLWVQWLDTSLNQSASSLGRPTLSINLSQPLTEQLQSEIKVG